MLEIGTVYFSTSSEQRKYPSAVKQEGYRDVSSVSHFYSHLSRDVSPVELVQISDQPLNTFSIFLKPAQGSIATPAQ